MPMATTPISSASASRASSHAWVRWSLSQERLHAMQLWSKMNTGLTILIRWFLGLTLRVTEATSRLYSSVRDVTHVQFYRAYSLVFQQPNWPHKYPQLFWNLALTLSSLTAVVLVAVWWIIFAICILLALTFSLALSLMASVMPSAWKATSMPTSVPKSGG